MCCLTKKLWDYIKKNGLQDKKVKTQINADDKLKVIFGGKKAVSMFEMTKLVSAAAVFRGGFFLSADPRNGRAPSGLRAFVDAMLQILSKPKIYATWTLIVLVGGLTGWWGWRENRRRNSQALLAQALADHFADPPLLEKAEAEYTQALQFDPALAPAHYYLAHLYAQMTLRGNPPPQGEVLDALRDDAQRHFTRALEGAERLNGAQQVIARSQLALLDTRNEPAPLKRPVEVAAADGPVVLPSP
eukprot:gene13934-18454_t